MRIGVPKEIKNRENRVGLTPEGVARLTGQGHAVVIEAGAGKGSGFDDAAYTAAGAELVDQAAAWGVDLVVKIKEPLEAEYAFLRGQTVFTYFHLAGVTPSLTAALLDSRTTAIAYETVEDAAGRLPLLAPMSAVAGTMAVPMGTYYLARFNGGRGLLPGRILGESFGQVLIVGDGVVGRHAAAAALGLGAHVTIAGRHPERAATLRAELGEALQFIESTPANLARALTGTDLLVGAVLLRGARAPHVVSRDMVAAMPAGAVLVDVSIDQGGCIETARATSHSDPVYTECEVIHYCVTNMPGAYPRTSTLALTRATGAYVERLAAHGLDALREDPGFARGLNTLDGHLTCAAVAEALGLEARYRAFDPA
ncbi:MAG: alanine dehydrogenase [Gammaproteobacteria bacterium]|nr:alanine dehydrogenase [Gammaproteobacteria bacterium]MCP5201076.1 alanine dehydrogenase [Gammaproteobacteria bacterium]